MNRDVGQQLPGRIWKCARHKVHCRNSPDGIAQAAEAVDEDPPRLCLLVPLVGDLSGPIQSPSGPLA